MGMIRHTGLFPKATEEEIERTKFLLKKYTSMRMLMNDFEEHSHELQQIAIDGEVARRIAPEDLHADKTANAVILLEKQRWVYEQYRFYTSQLQRAVELIRDEDIKKTVHYRYIKGHSFKQTMLYLRSIMSDSTIKRKLNEGIAITADVLKLFGFFDQDTEERLVGQAAYSTEGG